MRGRYASFLPAEAAARLFHNVNPIPNHPPTWNVTPTHDAMVVRRHPETGERHLDQLKWGLLPSFAKDPVHAKQHRSHHRSRDMQRRHNRIGGSDVGGLPGWSLWKKSVIPTLYDDHHRTSLAARWT
jgi:putative SOS response-associated peptidase YedK